MLRHLGKLFAVPLALVGVAFTAATVGLALTGFGLPAAVVTAAGAWLFFASAKICWEVRLDG